MDVFTKKLLASLVAIAMIATAFTSFVMIGTTQALSPTCPLDEDFSGSWLPPGWTQEEAGEWMQYDDNHAGGTSPEADLAWDYIYGNYAYLDSKPVDTTSATSLTLEFKSWIDDYCCTNGLDDEDCNYGGDCGSYDCKVYTRANGSDSWTDVTPWSNPILGNVGPDTYSIDISSDIGSATQVRFEFDGYYYAIDDWYVDDVKICSDAVNTSPNTPSNPYPANHASGVSLNADLSWSGGDPDAGDTVTYDVYFGTSASPPFVETIGPYPATQSSLTYDPGALNPNTQYYWGIVATDNHAASTTGPLWDFTTGGGVCQDEPGPEVAFANLIAEGKLVIAYNFNPFTTVPTAVAGWTWYDPELPPTQNNLAMLPKNTAFWVKVTEECWLTYGTWNQPHLAAGWNNPVWLGC